MPKTLSTVQRKGFFITPIGEPSSDARYRSDTVLDHILKPALCPEFVDVIERADLMADPGEITPAIVNAIVAADLIIADLSDANPNVYYELAIAHAFAKPVIHIIEQGHKPRFDVKDVRAFSYGLHIDKALAAKATIIEAATIAKDRGNQPTLVSRAADLKAAASSDNPIERQIADLREIVLDIRYERDGPSPYAALLDDTQSSFPARFSTSSEVAKAEVEAALAFLKRASRQSIAQWLVQFVSTFGHLRGATMRYSGSAGHLLLEVREQPELVDSLDRPALLNLAHYALEMYAGLVSTDLVKRLPPLPNFRP